MYCFIDQDGVLVDFLGGVSKMHNRPLPYDNEDNYGIFDVENLWGITPREFWEPCDGPDFWVQLEETKEARSLVELVTHEFGIDNTAILTAPSMSPYCVPGKRNWMKQHFPHLAKNIIFTDANSKRFLAGPNRLLIDDRNENVEMWREAGGPAILMPRLWNKYHEHHNRSYDYVEILVKNYKSTMEEEEKENVV